MKTYVYILWEIRHNEGKKESDLCNIFSDREKAKKARLEEYKNARIFSDFAIQKCEVK